MNLITLLSVVTIVLAAELPYKKVIHNTDP